MPFTKTMQIEFLGGIGSRIVEPIFVNVIVIDESSVELLTYAIQYIPNELDYVPINEYCSVKACTLTSTAATFIVSGRANLRPIS